MSIGMTIGAISFQPYVYHVNAIGPASMNRLSRISDNVLDKKTEYKGIGENENPLKKGQTLDFQGMLEMQMQRGRSNAARIMKPAREQTQETGQTQTAKEESAYDGSAGAVRNEQMTVEDMQTAANTENGGAGNGISNFRMQQAVRAYEMFMTA